MPRSATAATREEAALDDMFREIKDAKKTDGQCPVLDSVAEFALHGDSWLKTWGETQWTASTTLTSGASVGLAHHPEQARRFIDTGV